MMAERMVAESAELVAEAPRRANPAEMAAALAAAAKARAEEEAAAAAGLLQY